MNRAGIETPGAAMMPILKQYADRPNLWRVACELSKFKDPYKAADALLAMPTAAGLGEARA